jgi:hypothetical protein
MKNWSKLKKAVVITTISLFGLAGIGAVIGPEESTRVSPPPTPSSTPTPVQGADTSTEPQVEPAPEPPPPPPPVPEPTPAPVANCVAGYDPCIEPGPDVDCAGGSGNGPRYISGPVYVTGSDPYDLDRDGDGIGCE